MAKPPSKRSIIRRTLLSMLGIFWAYVVYAGLVLGTNPARVGAPPLPEASFSAYPWLLAGIGSLGVGLAATSFLALLRSLKTASLSRSPASLSRQPASRVDGALRFVFTKRTYERVFGQIITDAREEHLEALDLGHVWHARWIHARVYIILGATILTWVPTALLKRIVAIWTAS